MPKSLSTLFNSWLYDSATCQVIHNGKLSEAFEVIAGVRQDWLPIVTDDILNCGGLDCVSNCACGVRRLECIGLTVKETLEDMDFARGRFISNVTQTGRLRGRRKTTNW
ncbi:unnamed protein product [Trichobilharzia szidati]|nr:unnamed protein product [Trichobilharzia szidati]